MKATVTSITRRNYETACGRKFLANVTVSVEGLLTLKGATIVDCPDKGIYLRIVNPSRENDGTGWRLVLNEDVYRAMRDAAFNAYKAIGGALPEAA